jgi:hypothetical protein
MNRLKGSDDLKKEMAQLVLFVFVTGLNLLACLPAHRYEI